MPKQSHTFCHCEGALRPWRSVIPYISRPLFPSPRRLEMAIMLSMESMRHHGAWQQKITQPPKSSRAKQILYDSFGSGDGDAREQRLAYLT